MLSPLLHSLVSFLDKFVQSTTTACSRVTVAYSPVLSREVRSSPHSTEQNCMGEGFPLPTPHPTTSPNDRCQVMLGSMGGASSPSPPFSAPRLLREGFVPHPSLSRSGLRLAQSSDIARSSVTSSSPPRSSVARRMLCCSACRPFVRLCVTICPSWSSYFGPFGPYCAPQANKRMEAKPPPALRAGSACGRRGPFGPNSRESCFRARKGESIGESREII